MGDHTETLQIDYDPTQIFFEELLDIFWQSHNPTRRTWSAQYKAAIFVHNEEQAALARASKAQLAAEKSGRWFGNTIHTEILTAETFYLAEDYHHKYMLQHAQGLWGEVLAIYPETADWINSTAAARLNGYVGGHGTLTQLDNEIESLGLSLQQQDELRRTVARYS